MTRGEAVMELRRCQSNPEIESAHIDADSVLAQLLTELGYKDVVDEWEKVEKRYA